MRFRAIPVGRAAMQRRKVWWVATALIFFVSGVVSWAQERPGQSHAIPEVDEGRDRSAVRILTQAAVPEYVSSGVADGVQDTTTITAEIAIVRHTAGNPVGASRSRFVTANSRATERSPELHSLSRAERETSPVTRVAFEIVLLDDAGAPVASVGQTTEIVPPFEIVDLPFGDRLAPFVRTTVSADWSGGSGRNASGPLVPDGVYTYRLTATAVEIKMAPDGTSSERAIGFASSGGIVTMDNEPPTVEPLFSPGPNVNGWNRTDVAVEFTCDDSLSGVIHCTPRLMFVDEGGGQVVLGSATDRAGNVGTVEGVVNIDKTAPDVDSVAEPAANGNGWNNTDVVVSFDAIDLLSGVAQVADPVLVVDEGKLQQVTGVATDLAGNVGSHTAEVSIDKTEPFFSEFMPQPCPATTEEIRPVIMACFDDELSGVDLTTVTLSVDAIDQTGQALIEGRCIGLSPTIDFPSGEHQSSIEARDLAGNLGMGSWCFDVAASASPLDVTIDQPLEGLLTNGTFVDVSGQVTASGSSLASVKVNGVPAVLTGSMFFAEGVVLREGINLLTATAESVSGRVGAATVSVTRDTAPPRLVITAPRADGQLATTTVDVAGEINDTVVGTVNATEVEVTVNGVPAAVMNRGFRANAVPVEEVNPGVGRIVAVARDAAGNESQKQIDVRLAPPSSDRIVEISGNDQTAQVGELLAEPLLIGLKDGLDQAVPDQTVIFRVSRGDGSFETGERSIAMETDAFGRAEARFRLGSRFGAGNNRVEASAPGFAGRVYFAANATRKLPDKVAVVSGNNQLGIVGKKLPESLTVIVSDEEHNCIDEVPVSFRILEGGGRFENDEPEITVLTDSNGWASTSFFLGPMEGNDNNVVEVDFEGLEKLAARFAASGRIPGPVNETSFLGIVLDNTDVPIPGATVGIPEAGLVTTTGDDGQFLLIGAPAGSATLEVDGSTTSRPGEWPSLEFHIVTVPGRENDLGRPIYLPRLTTEIAAVSETQGGVCTISSVPGFRLEIEPGSATFGDGTKTGVVSVTQVHPDKVPMPPPMNMNPPIIVTIQPPDVHFDPPARLQIPNFEGLAPGETTEMFSFDHDLGMFVSIGTGTVSEDGAFLFSDPGQGVIKGGWHCGGQASSASGNSKTCPDTVPCKTADCDPQTGECINVQFAPSGTPCCAGGNPCGVCNGSGSCSIQPIPDPTFSSNCDDETKSAFRNVLNRLCQPQSCRMPPGVAASVAADVRGGYSVTCFDSCPNNSFGDGEGCGRGGRGGMKLCEDASCEDSFGQAEGLECLVLHELLHGAVGGSEKLPCACQQLCLDGCRTECGSSDTSNPTACTTLDCGDNLFSAGECPASPRTSGFPSQGTGCGVQ